MIKKNFFFLRYKIFFKYELFLERFFLSLKNLILNKSSLVGIYDLKYRDLSYDFYEYLAYLKIKSKLENLKDVRIYLYSSEKFEREKQFNLFFLKIAELLEIKVIKKYGSIKNKFNNFFFNTHFFENTSDTISAWKYLDPNKFDNLSFFKKIPKYRNKSNIFLKKNKLNKKKLVTLTVRNNPVSKKYNTPKKLIIKIFILLKNLNYNPLIINDNIYPMDFDKKFKVLNSNDFLLRSEIYKLSILNISTSRGAGNLIITLPTNWIIFNFQKTGIERYKFFKKLNKLKNNFSELTMEFNDFNRIKELILNFSKSNVKK